MRRWFWGWLGLLIGVPVGAGPSLERPERPRHEPPARPAPPPPEMLPQGPLSREQHLRFDALRTEGIDLFHAGRYDEAAQRFRQALHLKPDDAVTRRWLRAAEARQPR